MDEVQSLLKKMLAIVGHDEAEQESLSTQLLAAILGKAVTELLTTLPLDKRTDLEQTLKTNQKPLEQLNATFGEDKVRASVMTSANELTKRYLAVVQDKLTKIQKLQLADLFQTYGRAYVIR